MKKKLIILDLDETLIYATEHPLEVKHDFCTEYYYVYKRPFVDKFIDFCTSHFEVAVWTSAGEDYANEVVRRLFPKDVYLNFVWFRNRCVRRLNPELHEIEWIKDLKKVKRQGYRLDRIIAIDDTPSKLRRQYGNLVRVKPFEGDQKDDELRLLMKYLLRLKEVVNVRAVEKRGWRLKTQP